MGHAGAVIQQRDESAEAKTDRLVEVGALRTRSLLDVAPLVADALRRAQT